MQRMVHFSGIMQEEKISFPTKKGFLISSVTCSYNDLQYCRFPDSAKCLRSPVYANCHRPSVCCRYHFNTSVCCRYHFNTSVCCRYHFNTSVCCRYHFNTSIYLTFWYVGMHVYMHVYISSSFSRHFMSLLYGFSHT